MPAIVISIPYFQINAQEIELQKAEGTITTMQGEMQSMRSKIEEALKLIDIAKKLEEKIVSVQHRQDINAHNRLCQLQRCSSSKYTHCP